MDAQPLQPLQPEHAVYEVRTGPISWDAYTLPCPECGATDRWSLRVQTPPWTHGEEAWAVCSQGHTVRHPLIYPAMVHALLRWAAGDREAGSIRDVLNSMGWCPHTPLWRLADASDELHQVHYRGWDDPEAAPPGWWQDNWPELVQTAHDAGFGP